MSTFALSLKDLNTNILFIKRATGHTPGRAPHPALDALRIKVADGIATISFFDYETSVSVRMAATGDDTELVIGFGDLVRAIKETGSKESATFAIKGQAVTIASAGISVTVPLTIYAADVPSLPTLEGGTALVVTGAEFAQVAATTATAVGTDDTLPMLTGVKLESDGTVVQAAATDRFKLAVADVPSASVPPVFATLLPGRAIGAIGKRAAKDDVVSVTFEVAEQIGSARIDTDDTTVIVRSLDCEFPKWRQLLPADDTLSTSFEFDGQALAKKMKALAVTAPKVRFTISNNKVVANGYTHDSVEPVSSLEIDAGDIVCDAPLTVQFATPYVAQILGAVPRGMKVRLNMRNAERPSLFTWPGNKVLLMPVRMAS